MNNNNNKTFLPAKKIKQHYGVSSNSLIQWEKEGKINTLRTPGGNRLYCLQDIETMFGKHNKSTKAKICYARVSSDHQKQDLTTQIKDLKKKYPNHEIVSDIGSGLNWKRKGLISILERVYEGNVSEIIITHRDRLCIFGYELLEFIFEKGKCKIMVLDSDEKKEIDRKSELSEDLLTIINVLEAKNNEMRSGENKRRKKRDEEEEKKNSNKKRSKREQKEEGKDSSGESKEDTDVSE
jgi:putative resolvase